MLNLPRYSAAHPTPLRSMLRAKNWQRQWRQVIARSRRERQLTRLRLARPSSGLNGGCRTGRDRAKHCKTLTIITKTGSPQSHMGLQEANAFCLSRETACKQLWISTSGVATAIQTLRAQTPNIEHWKLSFHRSAAGVVNVSGRGRCMSSGSSALISSGREWRFKYSM